MTNEEKAEEYANACRGKIKDIHWQDIKYAVLYGLAEGGKEQENADKGFCESICMKGGRIAELEKENKKLAKMLELAMADNLNIIFADTPTVEELKKSHPWEVYRAELEKRVENEK